MLYSKFWNYIFFSISTYFEYILYKSKSTKIFLIHIAIFFILGIKMGLRYAKCLLFLLAIIVVHDVSAKKKIASIFSDPFLMVSYWLLNNKVIGIWNLNIGPLTTIKYLLFFYFNLTRGVQEGRKQGLFQTY